MKNSKKGSTSKKSTPAKNSVQSETLDNFLNLTKSGKRKAEKEDTYEEEKKKSKILETCNKQEQISSTTEEQETNKNTLTLTPIRYEIFQDSPPTHLAHLLPCFDSFGRCSSGCPHVIGSQDTFL